MDFSNRTTQPQPAARPAAPAPTTNRRKQNDSGKWFRIAVAAGIGAVIVLIVGAIVALGASEQPKEAKAIDASKLQAVFLNTGQGYFGDITELNDKFLTLNNIYYLQTSNASSTTAAQTTNNNNVSLVKLGCELHEPLDKMVINRDQVTFWENLGDNGQVAKAVAAFQKQNPDGQKCADQSNASGNTSNNVQSASPANRQ